MFYQVLGTRGELVGGERDMPLPHEEDRPQPGIVEFRDVEEERKMTLDAKGMREDYLQALGEFRQRYQTECARANIDFVPIDTSVSFDKALLGYLLSRQRRF